MAYPRVVHAVLSGEIPHGYTTLKSEKQLEENLMGVLRARTRKACPLPREHGPVNWYSAPRSLDGVPFRFPWSQDFIRKVIRTSTSADPPIDPLYSFKCITLPNRYWKEPLGWPRAKPVGRAPKFSTDRFSIWNWRKFRVGSRAPPKSDKGTSSVVSLHSPEDLHGSPRAK